MNPRLFRFVGIIIVSAIVALSMYPLLQFLQSATGIMFGDPTLFATLAFLTMSIGVCIAWFWKPKQTVASQGAYVEQDVQNPSQSGVLRMNGFPQKQKQKTKQQLKYEEITEKMNDEIPRENEVELVEPPYAGELRQKYKAITGEDLPINSQAIPSGTEKEKQELSKTDVSNQNLIRLSNAMVNRMIKDLEEGTLHVMPDQKTIENLGLKGFNVRLEKRKEEDGGNIEEEPPKEESPELSRES